MIEYLLAFLYASMPLPDSVDYSRDFWVQNIETTLEARQEMPWGATIPEREFMHFVLPVRVNNENLDDSRTVFYNELKDRVCGLSMSEAILEVNHWCHERVTYQPSDERTSSPLATVRTAYGRCGEESTFLVSALRAVGIPARQVYTPRWAHTDDNHAWVEAWADGKWHFLGACEPEAVLDLGWFNAPASRGMLMNTKAFGNYQGPEHVMQRNRCFTEIDVTSNYAPVGQSYVQVTDTEGHPVQNAQVEFKIYNYAEFYTIARHQTDANGVTSMQAGRGDLVAWAYQNGQYGFSRCPIADGDTIQVMLNHHSGETYRLDMEIVPPHERNTVPSMTEAQRQNNNERLQQENSIRNSYVATFPSDPALTKARGNYAVIRDFRANAEDQLRAEGLLSNISDKDWRDVPLEVLDDSYRLAPVNDGLDSAFYYKYVVSPRIANEKLTPFRSYFLQHIPMSEQALFRYHPEALIQWVKDSISIDTERNPQQLRMTPVGAYRNRCCDTMSRNILFVAMARTFGIPARIDPVTGKTQYVLSESPSEWKTVIFEDTDNALANAPTGNLRLTYEPQGNLINPSYYSHFTLSKIDQGCPTLLNYGEEDTWSSLFGNGKAQQLDAGDYLLTTGTRMANGSVLVHLEVVPIEAGQQVDLPLILRQAKQGLQVIGSLNSEALYQPLQGSECSILSTTGRGYYVLGLIAPHNEPTNHALRDIAKCREAFDQWGGTLVLLFQNQADAAGFNFSDFPELPKKTVIGIDSTGKIYNEIVTGMNLNSPNMPLFVIADTFNRVVFLSQGYTIGLGEQLVKGLNETSVK